MTVESWVQSSAERISQTPIGDADISRAFRAAHLNEIDPGASKSALTLEGAIEYLETANVALGENSDVRLALAFPLEISTSLDTFLPDLSQLVTRDNEPPSLYLFSAAYFLLAVDTWEKFSCGYKSHPWGTGWAVVYECAHPEGNPGSIKEYNRTIWVHPTR